MFVLALWAVRISMRKEKKLARSVEQLKTPIRQAATFDMRAHSHLFRRGLKLAHEVQQGRL